jgi:thioester reductase-like protein
MSSPERVQLVTGYPGFIGKRLVRRLVQADDDGPRLVLLVQPKHAAAARAELASLGARRAEVVEGDVEQMHLGLSGAEFKALAAGVTQVWHLAAISWLGADPRYVKRVNVEGTRNVLELAQRAPRLQRLNHFSTALVSGDRSGVILEDELAMGQRFHNAYEESKHQAELLVRRAQAELPVTIYRPSIVVGDSRTGEIDRFEGPYALAILLVASPLAVPLLPAGGAAPLNVVPIDFVVEAALSLARNPAAAGKTVHLVDPAPLSARRVYELIAARTGKRLASLSLPSRAFQTFLQLPGLERLARAQRPAIDYLSHLAIYNCRNQLDLLDGTGIRCPPITGYLERLIEFVQSSFARRREEAAGGGEPEDPLDPRD